MIFPKHKAQRTNSGFTLFELIVTTILLGVMAGTLVPLLGHAARHQRESDRRQLALYEAQNVLEQLAARPWPELTPDAAAAVSLPESCRESLPGARLTVTIDEPAGETAVRRISVELAWLMRDGVEVAPVRLVAWRYAPGGEADAVSRGGPE